MEECTIDMSSAGRPSIKSELRSASTTKVGVALEVHHTGGCRRMFSLSFVALQTLMGVSSSRIIVVWALRLR